MSAVKNILLLLKLDSQRLFERIKYRCPEYMQIFSSKRTRDHFGDIFKSRYEEIGPQELASCGEDVLLGLDQFYNRVEQLEWYLKCTQEMPGTVEDKVQNTISEIERHYSALQFCLDDKLGIASEGPSEEQVVIPEFHEHEGD